MKKFANLNGNRWITVVWSVLAVVCVFAYCYHQTPFMMTNDNFYLKSIVSGEMTGTPEFRMYYIGIVFGGVVSGLYRFIAGVAWYGITLSATVVAALSYLLYRILKTCDKNVTKLTATLLFCFFAFGFFTQHIVKAEYTTITGIAGCASLLALYLLEECMEKKAYRRAMLPVLAFAVWSAGMRDKAFLMLLPFVGMIFLGKLLDAYAEQDGAVRKRRWHNLAFAGGIFAGVIVLLLAGTAVAYGRADWRVFRTYTNASEELFDFYGFPDYDSHNELYEELGITRSSYEAITTHYNILLDPAINVHSMQALAEVGREENRSEKGGIVARMHNVTEKFIERSFLSYADRPLNILTYLLYLFAVIAAFCLRKKGAVRDLAFLLIARMFLWLYLLDGGRFPARVTQIIYIAEIFLLVGTAIRHCLWKAFMISKGSWA